MIAHSYPGMSAPIPIELPWYEDPENNGDRFIAQATLAEDTSHRACVRTRAATTRRPWPGGATSAQDESVYRALLR
jgi:hypothetical protein